ncbi:HK97 gp10 family phage protein [Fructobacillus sp. CRL 2054]|uniref:HK97-gp10 family putative phage morphogenesis protein n=1 Tax=Fructobacillus sp. CRL 2054 TaxID=2763007 RepID=UPI002379B8DD|nr:HK97-gp10 family putative phage morphogenesis protein [Fructobacillus sp. CRL 2054]MDD9138314.1 HK97 gp10 family phage protein [Fructobacillus sp. CRL 2054]
MSDFESQLGGWLNKVGGLVNLTVEEREEVTKAGADVFADHLKPDTPYNSKRKGKMIHLRDSVQIGRLEDESKSMGNTAVGFPKKGSDGVNHARIARFVNDGTSKMEGNSFVDKAQVQYQDVTSNAIQEALSKVQARKAK